MVEGAGGICLSLPGHCGSTSVDVDVVSWPVIIRMKDSILLVSLEPRTLFTANDQADNLITLLFIPFQKWLCRARGTGIHAVGRTRDITG